MTLKGKRRRSLRLAVLGKEEQATDEDDALARGRDLSVCGLCVHPPMWSEQMASGHLGRKSELVSAGGLLHLVGVG